MTRLVYFLVSHSSAGGAQEIWTNLAEAFRERGDHVRLMALYPPGSTIRETPPDLPWHYVIAKRASGPIGIMRALAGLVGILRKDPPDLIISALPAANILASLAAYMAGLKQKVVTSHHTAMETYTWLLKRMDTLTGSLHSVKTIVSVSDTVSSSLAKKPACYRTKRQTIHNALPPAIEKLLQELRETRREKNGHGRKVVATGRLAEQKNYPLLIRAAAHMPDVEVDIVGTGPDEDALRDLARDLGVADRVHFLGHRPRPQTMQILAGGDVFVQVSNFEGHSLALIEAAKLGLPLVVSDVPVQIEGITRKSGEQCGIAVALDDDVGLASEITRLLDDPDALAFRSRQAQALGDEATFEAMVDSYRELLIGPASNA